MDSPPAADSLLSQRRRGRITGKPEVTELLPLPTIRGMITSSQERNFRALDNVPLCSQRFLPRCYARDFTFPACLLPPYQCLSRIKFLKCRDLPISRHVSLV
jgi:hypothetical protein